MKSDLLSTTAQSMFEYLNYCAGMSFRKSIVFVLAFSFLSACLYAESSEGASASSGNSGSKGGESGGTPLALPPNYRLNVTDTITITVFEEPELGVTQRIPANGKIRIPLLGEINLLDLTVREAEYKIQEAFIDARLLRKPQVYITVSGYVAQEFSVFGQLGAQGQIPFPVEKDSMDIIEAVSRAGGFTGIARGTDVRVTRRKPDGTQEYFNLDVESMIEDQEEGDYEEFLIYPGDIIYVPERLF